MGRNQDNNREQPEEPSEEQTEVKTLISSKQFVQKLKKETKGISGDVLKAFISISPKMDMEENYRKVWDTTFKRK